MNCTLPHVTHLLPSKLRMFYSNYYYYYIFAFKAWNILFWISCSTLAPPTAPTAPFLSSRNILSSYNNNPGLSDFCCRVTVNDFHYFSCEHKNTVDVDYNFSICHRQKQLESRVKILLCSNKTHKLLILKMFFSIQIL